MQQRIITKEAPAAIGPYSQGISVQGKRMIFVSGQLPIDPASGKLLTGEIKVLTRQVIQNIDAILKAAGSGLRHVVKTEIFLIDLKNDFAQMNEEYALWFTEEPVPARQTIQAAALPMGSRIEVSCIAIAD